MASYYPVFRPRAATLALLLSWAGPALPQATRGVDAGPSTSTTARKPVPVTAAASQSPIATSTRPSSPNAGPVATRTQPRSQSATNGTQRTTSPSDRSSGLDGTDRALIAAGVAAAAVAVWKHAHEPAASNAPAPAPSVSEASVPVVTSGPPVSASPKVDSSPKDPSINPTPTPTPPPKHAPASPDVGNALHQLRTALQRQQNETARARAGATREAADARSARALATVLGRKLEQVRDETVLWAALAAAVGLTLGGGAVRWLWPRVTQVVKPMAVSVRLSRWSLETRPSGGPRLAFNIKTQWAAGQSRVHAVGALVTRPMLVEPRSQEVA